MSIADSTPSSLRSVLIGGALGAALGLLGAPKAVLKHSPLLREDAQLELLALGTVAGAVAGLLWPVLTKLRQRGALGFYAAWSIALAVVGMTLMIPAAIGNRSWLEVLFGAFLGSLAGFALAALVRYSHGPKDASR